MLTVTQPLAAKQGGRLPVPHTVGTSTAPSAVAGLVRPSSVTYRDVSKHEVGNTGALVDVTLAEVLVGMPRPLA